VAGVLLVILTYGFTSANWRRLADIVGWLFMVPIGRRVFAAGGTIVGSPCPGAVWFQRVRRATGLYRDWWMTGAVNVGSWPWLQSR